MSNKWIIIGIGVWALAFVACSSIFHAEGRLASAKAPRFDHAGHLGRDVECSMCHGEEDEAWMAMPEYEFCMECHEEIDPEAAEIDRADAFYDEDGVGQWLRAGAQSAEIKFTHAKHVQASGEENCTECHADVAESTAIYTGFRLSMEQCIECHERQAPDYMDCASCHEEIREGVAPPSHGAGWTRLHGRRGMLDHHERGMTQDCAYCHTQSSCDSCHAAEMPRDHNNAWRHAGHGLSASIDRDRCEVCHTEDSCAECHRQSEPRSHRAAWGGAFNRHCNGCHLPVGAGLSAGCGVCHDGAPSHAMAPMLPPNLVHQTMNPNDCRACHTPLEHTDNGQSCLLCHQ